MQMTQHHIAPYCINAEPQGSVFSPVLFHIYITFIASKFKLLEVFIYMQMARYCIALPCWNSFNWHLRAFQLRVTLFKHLVSHITVFTQQTHLVLLSQLTNQDQLIISLCTRSIPASISHHFYPIHAIRLNIVRETNSRSVHRQVQKKIQK